MYRIYCPGEFYGRIILKKTVEEIFLWFGSFKGKKGVEDFLEVIKSQRFNLKSSKSAV